jgi:hypothetical protein
MRAAKEKAAISEHRVARDDSPFRRLQFHRGSSQGFTAQFSDTPTYVGGPLAAPARQGRYHSGDTDE